MSQSEAGPSSGRASPALSDAPSTYSFHSSVDGHIFREVFGRVLNTQNETYTLPCDAEEHSRLDLQHTMLSMALGSLYYPPGIVEKLLSPRGDDQPSIMDIGTGSGTWAIAMAQQFPHAEVVGLDLVPPHLGSGGASPPNLRFEIDDANLGFSHYPNRFDVVHVRTCATGITDLESFLQEVAYMLRPGGIVLFVDDDFQLYSKDKVPLDPGANPGDPLFSWMEKLFFEAYNCMKARGASTDTPHLLPHLLRRIPSLSQPDSLSLYIPIGPWHTHSDKRSTHISELLRETTLGYARALRPLLLMEGYFEGMVDGWIKGVEEELGKVMLGDGDGVYKRWCYAWAVKKEESSAVVGEGYGTDSSETCVAPSRPGSTGKPTP